MNNDKLTLYMQNLNNNKMEKKDTKELFVGKVNDKIDQK